MTRLPPLLAWFAFSASALAAVPEKVGFNEHIRPILSNTCFYCHGPDEKHRDGKRRLDLREEAIADHEGTRAIVPGKPEESEMMLRLLSHDKDEQMPPPKSKKPLLSEEEIATIRRWIAQGAEYEGHWAFQPLKTAPPPVVKNAAWVRNPIDLFIEARLEREGIAPSPEADRATLIRRVSLDLTGLLPTPEEVTAFVSDPAPDAYDRLVTRLLADPHYGERWGRHWLDQARYADSNGYSIDSERAMWPYRDWVIKALNDDLPFDEFSVEQLAGDLLPQPTKSQLIATAYHRNTLINEEGGVKPEQFRVESVIDRVNTTGSVWLGLTVGCAQCHSHKFDPISHQEYYQMLAFFNQGEDVNNKGATLDVARGEVFGKGPTAEERAKAEAKSGAVDQGTWEKAELAKLEQETTSKPAPAGAAPLWSPAQYLEYDTAGGGGLRVLADNSILSDGHGPFNDTYRVLTATKLKQIAAVRLRVLTHESLPKKGPGLAGNGNFVLTEVEASANGAEVRIASARADHEQPRFGASAAIDGDPKTGWAINTIKGDTTVKLNSDHELVLVFEKPVPGTAALEFKLHHDLNEKYLVGRFALEFSETPPGDAAQVSTLVTSLRTAPDQRTPEQAKLILEAYQSAHPVAKAAAPAKKGKRDANADVVALLVMKDVEKPRETFLFQRGDFLRPDEKLGPLQPGVIAAVAHAMPSPTGEFRNRLDLARWLVSPENPLTPRVAMNRVWMRYFGRGLVETDDDFGSQGTPPTHPELLDWLAGEFIRQGWSLKAMHRLIVTSATYRQSSKARPDLAEKDARNLLLARQSRVRMEAEIIRDAALCASGLLSPEIGGPSVKPPQPAGVYSFTQKSKDWTAATGPERYRRALYTMFYRSAPHPLFTTFDAPDFQQVCTRRTRSNTPLQALMLANDAAFFEFAQALAARAQREAKGDGALDREFCLAIGRPPSPKEASVLRGYYRQQVQAFTAEPEAARAMLPKDAAGQTPETAAALVGTARAILNSDAFITRE